MSDTDRPTLGIKTPARPTAAQLEALAFEKLWQQNDFRIFLFTLFRTASMFDAAYGTDGRHLPFVEGRRSLGFNILRSAQQLAPDALALITAAGYKLQKEAPNGRRKQYDRIAELDRHSDGGSDRGDDDERGHFLDYGE